MAFKTSQWFTPEELADDEQPEQLSPKWDAAAAAIKAADDREQIKQRLWSEGAADLGNKLANCGLPMQLVCVCCGDDTSTETRCRRRWCPACAWTIQRKRIDRFQGAVNLMRHPAMLTLTQPNSPDPETIRDLRSAWSRMRRRKLIVEKIAGGVAAIEVTNNGTGWHPHLHAIIDCQWLSLHVPAPTWADSQGVFEQKCEMAQAELSRLWANVIDEQHGVCWITRMRDMKALVYSLKYCVKGSDLLSSPDDIAPMIRVLDKSRLISAFGNLHGRTAEMDADERPAMVCTKCNAERSIVPAAVVYSMVRTDPAEALAKRMVAVGRNHTNQSQPR